MCSRIAEEDGRATRTRVRGSTLQTPDVGCRRGAESKRAQHTSSVVDISFPSRLSSLLKGCLGAGRGLNGMNTRCQGGSTRVIVAIPSAIS
jgi:hypothetical protein